MPIERVGWRAVHAWDPLNAQLGRAHDVLDGNDRVVTLTATATSTLALGRPRSLIEADTTAGAVALTLPSAPGHVGYTVHVVKTAGASALTVNGTPVTTFATFVSTGALWRQVG